MAKLMFNENTVFSLDMNACCTVHEVVEKGSNTFMKPFHCLSTEVIRPEAAAIGFITGLFPLYNVNSSCIIRCTGTALVITQEYRNVISEMKITLIGKMKRFKISVNGRNLKFFVHKIKSESALSYANGVLTVKNHRFTTSIRGGKA
jgi:hypothetical protein